MKIKDCLFFLKLKLIFFEFFFNIFNEKTLDNVSTVFPDFEIIIKRTLEKFSFFLKLIILFSLRSSKKYIFFFIFV